MAHTALCDLVFQKRNIVVKKIVKAKLPLIVAAAYSPIRLGTGLTVVLVDSAVDSEVAREVLTQQVMAGGGDLGVQFAKSKVVRTWQAGGRRQQEYVKAANSYYPGPPVGTRRIVRCVEVDRRFNWLSDAGWMAVGKTIAGSDKRNAHGDWNILLQNGAAFEDHGAMQFLFKLSQAAKNAGNHAMVIIGGVIKLNDSAEKLFSLCDEVITVEACEADPDTYCAIKIAIPSLHHSHQFGKGAVMASLVRAQEQFKINIEPFIATELRQRLAWRMYGAGKSLDEIGQYVGFNKSTVSRWFPKMPPVIKASITEEEINQALEAIECLRYENKKSAPRPAFSTQGERQTNRKVR